jgi:NADPH:quinone reductase-like Zn-dependent oxidoreductase
MQEDDPSDAERERRNAQEYGNMKAIQYRAGGYAENRLVDVPIPTPTDGQALVEMQTVGINPLDNTFRSGHHYAATPENLPRVGGQMGAGKVVESKSANFKTGDRVFVTAPGFGIVADGTWREVVAAPAAMTSSERIIRWPIQLTSLESRPCYALISTMTS